MAKFASQTPAAVKGGAKSVIKSKAATVTNHEGVTAFKRNAKSDLFLLGVTNFVSEDTFYEKGDDRDKRYVDLVHKVTKKDAEWVANFVAYLRGPANMRSVAVVTACEYVKAGGPNGRAVVASACQRADEPGEVLAYWTNKYGRSIPAAVKRGVADAARRLYNEKSFIKYDSSNNKWRFADVLQLAHVKPVDEKQEALFKAALDARYGNVTDVPEALTVVAKYRALHKMDKDEARKILLSDPTAIKDAGMTWESLSSFGPMDSKAWEAVIPSMGYMALLRNLRNFDEQKVSNTVANKVAAKLADPDEVARSRQLIFRFYSAYKNAPSLRWGNALEQAMDLATLNIPVLGGRTLVLVDTSASMTGFGYSAKSTATPVETAALFGAALAKSGQAVDLRMFASDVKDHTFPVGGSVLSTADSLVKRIGEVGHGTDIGKALDSWNGQDRVIILTDMQTQTYVGRGSNARSNWYGDRTGGSKIPLNVPIYGFNLAGYAGSQVDTENNMYEFGGLTDATFKMITALEAGRNAVWPWETK